MEKQLTAASRDRVLFESEKNQFEFNQKALEAFQDSNASFERAVDKFSASMAGSLQMLANAIAGSAQAAPPAHNSTARASTPPPFNITEEGDVTYYNM